MLAWVFERQNREVRFVTRFFAKRREAVVKITWLDGIKPGASVRPGTELATLTWSNGQRQRLRAPAGCVGKIAAVNRRIAPLMSEGHRTGMPRAWGSSRETQGSWPQGNGESGSGSGCLPEGRPGSISRHFLKDARTPAASGAEARRRFPQLLIRSLMH